MKQEYNTKNMCSSGNFFDRLAGFAKLLGYINWAAGVL